MQRARGKAESMGAPMAEQDVFIKILESHTKHQEFVEERLLDMAQTINDTNSRIIRLEAAGIENRLQRLSDRLTLLENDKLARDGGNKLLEKIPGWFGWMAALALGFYEYLRVTKGN